jgi:hypothetical protein
VRRHIALAFLALAVLPAAADKIDFTSIAHASLVFEDDYDPTRDVPHLLKVFLRVRTTHDSTVGWVANRVSGVEAELLGPDGRPARSPDGITVVSIRSGIGEFTVPYGSRLDWLISHGGISFTDSHDPMKQLAVLVGGKIGLVPLEDAASYSLRVRVHGVPWTRRADDPQPESLEVLFDVPPTKIELAK